MRRISTKGAQKHLLCTTGTAFFSEHALPDHYPYSRGSWQKVCSKIGAPAVSSWTSCCRTLHTVI